MGHPDDNDIRTEFLNVDLDVFSRESLAPFVKALERSFFVLHEGRWGRKYGAILELHASGYGKRTADSIIRRMSALLNKMPDSARELWNRAQIRQFNIGIQAARKPVAVEFQVGQDTLQAVSRLGASLVITVYAPEARKPKSTVRPKKRISRPTTG